MKIKIHNTAPLNNPQCGKPEMGGSGACLASGTKLRKAMSGNIRGAARDAAVA